MGNQQAKVAGTLSAPSESLDLQGRRVRNRDAFIHAIGTFEGPRTTAAVDAKEVKNGMPRLRFAVRKRPLNEAEAAEGEFDVVRASDSLWLHKCSFRLDDKHMFLQNMKYNFADNVYDETHNSDAVFESSVRPLVAQALSEARTPGCVIMFGATGSGKTFTMNALLQRTCSEVFATTTAGGGAGATGAVQVKAQCIEVTGTRVTDLLSPRRPDAEVTILDDQEGRTNLIGASSHDMATAADLQAAFQRAFAARVTKATGVHDASSRSHVLYRILLDTTSVTLVDLAGSEWSRDQRKHEDASLRREAAQINTSLFTLRHCLSARAKFDRAGGAVDSTFTKYREAKLTRCLKDCFMGSNNTTVIGTISPGSSDTEHTQDLLEHLTACVEGGGLDGDEGSGAGAGSGVDCGVVVVTTAVEGETIHHRGASSGASEAACSGAGSRTAMSAKAEKSVLPADATQWTSLECVRWFQEAGVAARDELMRADLDHSPAAVAKATTFEVRLSAKRWVTLRAEKDSIGLGFEPSSAVVKKVLMRGYITMSKYFREKRLQPGCELVGVKVLHEGDGDKVTIANPLSADSGGGGDVLKSLKSGLSVFKKVATAQRDWEESRAQFMTDDMKALRRMVTDGPQGIFDQAKEGAENVDNATVGAIAAADAAAQVQVQAQAQLTQKEQMGLEMDREAAAQAVAIGPPPRDVTLALRFKDVATDAAAATAIRYLAAPEPPVIFTGMSRTGETWVGMDLVEKYALVDEGRLTKACNGDRRMGLKMWEDLKSRVSDEAKVALKANAEASAAAMVAGQV
jgi:kinesin family protein 2/24